MIPCAIPIYALLMVCHPLIIIIIITIIAIITIFLLAQVLLFLFWGDPVCPGCCAR